MNTMTGIFDALEAAGIRYAHFKSNTRLRESFAGKGDFDILVDRRRLAEVETILHANHGKRFNPTKYGRYPGVDNWIIFDGESGRLYHLHLHYQIASGKALVKDYVIPWAERVLATRVKDTTYGIYITEPNLELLLLTVRSVIKSHYSDWLSALLGRYRLHPALEEEKAGLLEQISESALREAAWELFEERDRELICRCALQPSLSSRDFLALNRSVRRAFKADRRMPAFAANRAALCERVGDVWAKLCSRRFGKNVVTKKTSLAGGAIIAFVGCDGAGKSTVTDEIQTWLSKKIECRRFYMGTGDGKTTALGEAIKGAGERLSPAATRQMQAPGRLSLFRQPGQFLRKFFKMLLISDVEKNNYRKLLAMQRYRLNGGISVLDRYPQIEMPGQNDGPKIALYSPYFGGMRLLDTLRRKEEAYLSVVRTVKPDVVFRLNVSAETVLKRKSDLRADDPAAVDKLRRKAEDVRKLRYQGARVIEIDAEQPYEKELLEIKTILWEEIL